ncbi:competence/damage-inducible protein A, partial [bacterium]|nr:competence/damage-inducible protein A [bacterium]
HPYLKTIMGRFCEVSDLSAAQLRLAEVPEKAELVVEDDEHIPQAYVGNIFMLPGIPEFFRQRFEKLADRFRGPELFHSSITLQGMETNLAASLNRTVRLHPDVAFGSYPSLAETDAPSSYRPVPCRIKVTFESSDQAKLAEAKEFLLKNLPDSLQLLEK